MLNFRKVYIYIFIISVIGLAFIQYQYLKIGLNLAKVQYDSKVGQAVQTIKEDLSTKNELTFLMEQAITEDDSYFRLSIDSLQDASSHFLDDFLVDRLLQRGIKTSFQYRLYENDSTVFLSSPHYVAAKDNGINYPIVLSGYLRDRVKKRLILELQFEDLNNYFLSQLNGLTIPSLIFIIAIIVVVIWVLRSMYWQRNVITTTNEFINNLTHELKTPVFSIGLASKLLQENATDATKPMVDIIREQNERLKNHIDKVLELASIEEKRKVLKMELQDFYPVLEKLATSFSSVARMQNIDFTYELKDAPYLLYSETSHLENAVSNLLDNARKYSENNPSIQLQAFIENRMLHIVVADKGIGISDKEAVNVFKKYHRVSSGDLHHVRGYGLGLNYVKQVVRLHKGKIVLDSKLGEGTTVTVKIPVQKDSL